MFYKYRNGSCYIRTQCNNTFRKVLMKMAHFTIGWSLPGSITNNVVMAAPVEKPLKRRPMCCCIWSFRTWIRFLPLLHSSHVRPKIRPRVQRKRGQVATINPLDGAKCVKGEIPGNSLQTKSDNPWVGPKISGVTIQWSLVGSTQRMGWVRK